MSDRHVIMDSAAKEFLNRLAVRFLDEVIGLASESAVRDGSGVVTSGKVWDAAGVVFESDVSWIMQGRPDDEVEEAKSRRTKPGY